MRIFMTGGTGFVGSPLTSHLLAAGHEVCLLLRPGDRVRHSASGLEVVEGDPLRPGTWWDRVATCQAAINLAGEPILGRWTEDKKRRIRESRVLTTRNLVEAIPSDEGFTLLSTSAVGIYGDAGERELDEKAPFGFDFLAKVAQEWEAEALVAQSKGARTVITRFAVVLGPDGGALEQMRKATERIAGGPLGSGRQWFSWIHRKDLQRAISFLLERSDLSGPFNLGAPNPVRQIDAARAIAKCLHRRAFLPAPAFALRLVLGDFADTLLFSQKMLPTRLLAAGFSFEYPEFQTALADALTDQTA